MLLVNLPQSYNMRAIVLLVTLVLTLNLIHTQNIPLWPSQFQVDFNETASFVGTGQTKGIFYYDYVNNKQFMSRENGKYDRYCGSVFKLTDTPCNHIIVQNKRFLDFPNKNYCCFCCDSAHGCGLLYPDWLVKGKARYVGTAQLDPQGPYNKWEIKGGQENYYYTKNDSSQTPRRLEQVPEDNMDFTNFKAGPVDPKRFVLPSYCTSQCGSLTICAGLRQNIVQK